MQAFLRIFAEILTSHVLRNGTVHALKLLLIIVDRIVMLLLPSMRGYTHGDSFSRPLIFLTASLFRPGFLKVGVNAPVGAGGVQGVGKWLREN